MKYFLLGLLFTLIGTTIIILICYLLSVPVWILWILSGVWGWYLGGVARKLKS
jgi:hypothetical protein